MSWTRAYLGFEIADDDTDIPAIRVETDGCGCCSHDKYFVDVHKGIDVLDATIETLQKRIDAIKEIRETVNRLQRIPFEREVI